MNIKSITGDFQGNQGNSIRLYLLIFYVVKARVMKRSVQAFEMKTLISALLDFTEPNFQGLPLCGPGKGKKAKINGKNSLDVMLRPELQPFPVCTPRGFIRFAKSDTRRPLHPCLRSNQDQFRLEVPPGSLSPQPCPTCWLLARELPAIPFATALTPHHSRVEAQLQTASSV